MDIMEPIKKRERTANFSRFEIDVLIEIIEKYKGIIENKKTDGVSLRKKAWAWQKVEEEFNSSPGTTQRTAEKLKTCFENTKRKVKQDLADEKMERRKTGGGSHNIKLGETSNKIIAMLGPSATPLANEFDSDALYYEDDQISNSAIVDENIVILDDDLPVLNACQSDDKENMSNSNEESPGKWRNRRLPKPPAHSSSHTAIKNACCKRVEVLDEELEARRKEHLKEMEIKELKIQVLKEKLKYWKSKNEFNL